MASSNKNVGSYGRIRVTTTVVSQSIANNTSRVRVRAYMALRTNVPARNNNGVAMNISGSGGITTRNANKTFNITSQSWKKMRDETYTVSHASSGKRTVTAKFTLGSTGTTTFGTGGSVSVSHSLPRIARVPSKPARPTASGITHNKAKVSWKAPASNGAKVDKYQIRFYRETGSAWRDNTVTGRSRTYGGPGLDGYSVYRARVRAHNAAGWGAWSEYLRFRTKSAPPKAPTNVSVVQQSDLKVKISWKNNATSTAPYGSQRVQRSHYINADEGWSAWTQIANISENATSYTDTGLSKNNAFRWRVQSSNGTGKGMSATSDTVRTTPEHPTGLVAQKNSAGDIEISWSASVPYDVYFEVEDNPGDAGWEPVGTSTSTAFNHTEPDAAESHTYRVRTVSDYDSDVKSQWSSVSNTIQLLTPPDAPTLGSPVSETLNRDDDVTFRITHNPVDTTPQTEGEIRYRAQGDSWTTVSLGDADHYTMDAPGETATFEWQARTKGTHEDFGGWSPTATFDTASQPITTVQEPDIVDGTFDHSEVSIIWQYQNVDAGQARWEVELVDDSSGDVIEANAGAGTAESYDFSTILTNDHPYKVRVRARSGDGVWSEWDEVSFITDFPLPVDVTPEPEWDRDTGAVSLSFDVDEPRTYEWAGDPHSSVSIALGDDEYTAATNRVVNPSFENDQNLTYTGMDFELTDEEDAVFAGNHAGALTITAPDAQIYQNIDLDSDDEGETLAFSVLARLADGTLETIELVVEFLDNTDDTIRIDVLDEWAPTSAEMNEQVRHAGAIEIPDEARNARVILRFLHDNADDEEDITATVHTDAWITIVASDEQDALDTVGRYFDGSSQATTDVDSLDVRRRDDGGSWVTLAKDLDPDTSITDHTPMLGRVEYQVTARTDLPTAKNGPVVETEPPRGIWPVFLNTGSDLDRVIGIYDNTQMSFERERAKNRHQWAGREWPVTKWGQSRTKTATLTATISPDSPGATMSEVEEFEDYARVACVRDILGNKMFVTIDSVSSDVERDGRWSLSIPMTREDYREGVK